MQRPEARRAAEPPPGAVPALGERPHHGLLGRQLVAELADGDSKAGGLADHDLRLATAALLIHAAAIDGNVSEAERHKLQSLLQQRFELGDAAAAELIEQATIADEKAVDLYHFTHLLNDRLDEPDFQL